MFVSLAGNLIASRHACRPVAWSAPSSLDVVQVCDGTNDGSIVIAKQRPNEWHPTNLWSCVYNVTSLDFDRSAVLRVIRVDVAMSALSSAIKNTDTTASDRDPSACRPPAPDLQSTAAPVICRTGPAPSPRAIDHGRPRKCGWSAPGCG